MSDYKIRLKSVGQDDDDPEQTRVIFSVSGEYCSFEIPIRVLSARIDDADLIRVARNMLHEVLAGVAAETAAWVLSQEQIDSLDKKQVAGD